MAHIIGTAGHVDHGKTALIEALTGIDADRLPEEKKRGMTIDLGFAHFKNDRGLDIGVIDVPGHERFIRNMVAGAWSLSLAMIVVAADEGWMPQTEDHCRVLEAMGIEEVVCVLTKSDLVDSESLNRRTLETGEKLLRIFNMEVKIIPVSAITGHGIDTLRKYVTEALSVFSPRKSALSDSAYIHIDRAFTVKGAGTVITGSLAGGELSNDDELTILPKGMKARVRGIQSYHKDIASALPVSRVACNLHGIKKEDVTRGVIAVKNKEDFWTSREFIVRLESIKGQTKAIRNHMEIELAAGTGHYTGKIHFLKAEGYARVVFNEYVSASWLEPCLFIRHGGHNIMGKGNFICGQGGDHIFRRKMGELLLEYPVPGSISTESVFSIMLNGWVEIKKSSVRGELEAFMKEHNIQIRFTEKYAILENTFQDYLSTILEQASKPGGMSRSEFSGLLNIPEELKDLLIAELIDKNPVIMKDQLIMTEEQLDSETVLTPLGKKILDMMNGRDNKGLQFKELKFPGSRKELRNLIRMGRVLSLEGDVFYSREIFDRLVQLILKGHSSGDFFSIPHAKERTGLTRRYMIPVLNKMEEKGMVKRVGDKRMVV